MLFRSLDPRTAGVSQNTTFTLFKISWYPKDATLPEGAAVARVTDSTTGANGSAIEDKLQYDRPIDEVTPDSTRMEVGDRIELYFDVYASIDNLPQVYARNGVVNTAAANITGWGARTGVGTTGLEPAYFPRAGEYYQADYAAWSGSNWSGRIFPLYGSWTESGQSYHLAGLHDTWGAFNFATNDVLMDMDYLMLDSAFSGDKPEQTDTWEMFDGSYTYIPGESSSYGHYSSGWDVNGWGANGMGMYAYPHSTDGNNQNYHSNIRSSGGTDSVSSGYLLDTDMKTANNKQVVRYTPRPYEGTKGNVATKLPNDAHFVWWYDGSNEIGRAHV